METPLLTDQPSAVDLLADHSLQNDAASTDLADDVLYMRYKKLCAETKIKTEQAEIERLKKLRMQGELVDHATVCEAAQRIGSLVRSSLRRMVYELPPVLA